MVSSNFQLTALNREWVLSTVGTRNVKRKWVSGIGRGQGNTWKKQHDKLNEKKEEKPQNLVLICTAYLWTVDEATDNLYNRCMSCMVWRSNSIKRKCYPTIFLWGCSYKFPKTCPWSNRNICLYHHLLHGIKLISYVLHIAITKRISLANEWLAEMFKAGLFGLRTVSINAPCKTLMSTTNTVRSRQENPFSSSKLWLLSTEIKNAIDKAVLASPVVLFMKKEPQSFSMWFFQSTIQILGQQGVDPENLLRTRFRRSRNWETESKNIASGPPSLREQVYFVGGCDIVKCPWHSQESWQSYWVERLFGSWRARDSAADVKPAERQWDPTFFVHNMFNTISETEIKVKCTDWGVRASALLC